MFQQLYDEVAEDTSRKIRDDEMRAFRHSIALLEVAKKTGPFTKEAVDALFFLSRLWSILLEDLAHRENGLPDALRAQLISIGIWMLRYAESVRQGTKADFQPLIDISKNIYTGLQGKQ